jgi:hypothetical protein
MTVEGDRAGVPEDHVLILFGATGISPGAAAGAANRRLRVPAARLTGLLRGDSLEGKA